MADLGKKTLSFLFSFYQKRFRLQTVSRMEDQRTDSHFSSGDTAILQTRLPVVLVYLRFMYDAATMYESSYHV